MPIKWTCESCGLVSRSETCRNCSRPRLDPARVKVAKAREARAFKVITFEGLMQSLQTQIMREQYENNVRAQRAARAKSSRSSGPAPTAAALSTTIRIKRAPLEDS